MLKAVVHINFTDSEQQQHALKNVTHIWEEEKCARIAHQEARVFVARRDLAKVICTSEVEREKKR